MKIITAFIQIVTPEHGLLNFAPSANVSDEFFNIFDEMLKSDKKQITVVDFESI
jgi:hypothetical protein